MGYPSGKLHYRIDILQRVQAASRFSAASGKVTYQRLRTVWGGYSFDKGTKSMREGALDAYNFVMFFFHASVKVNRENFIGFKGKVYQIMSLNEDDQDDKIQITAVEIVGKISEPTPPVSNAALDATESEIKGEDI